MFNPHPYDDPDAINQIALFPEIEKSIVHGTSNVATALAQKFATGESPLAVAINAASSLYKPASELDAQLADHLPTDRVKDPVLLFGKRFHGKFEELFDAGAVDRLKQKVITARETSSVVFVYGCGCAAAPLRDLYDTILYFDVTPKRAILRARAGLVANIGDAHPRPFRELLRRLYYVDFEVAGALRKELLHEKSGAFRFYVARNATGECTLLPRASLDAALASLARQPFLCRPVYIEGVWGGSLDHGAFVHAVPSRPGTQLVLPGGTIHASGRNQVVLEIGSLTVGSYTYKRYDYLRTDLDGNPRPFHTYHGENVLDPRRVAPQVERELVPAPKLLRRDESGTKGWSEWRVGEHEDVYFSLRRIDIAPFGQAPDDTRGVFHVLALVDGEAIVIESQSGPARRYHAGYLDIVVVPANIGSYTIRNPGNQPVVVHKTLLKQE
jgi:hypothetical protein